MFSIFLGPSSRKFLKKCPKDIYERVIRKIKELAINPFPSDVKRVISKKEKIFRVRVGAYRIQYIVYHERMKLLFLI